MINKRVVFSAFTVVSVVIGVSFATEKPARADSCWNHNGSIMRLKAEGQKRWFYYEKPRAGLAVKKGILLFNGTNKGGVYSGLSRVFSKFCPSAPLEYFVEGSVSNNQTRVTMRGTRNVHKKCEPTGDVASDELVFNYSHKC